MAIYEIRDGHDVIVHMMTFIWYKGRGLLLWNHTTQMVYPPSILASYPQVPWPGTFGVILTSTKNKRPREFA